MATITSPNMNLPVPVVGQEPGPEYATDVNNSLNLIDAHNHSPGSGVQVTPDGLNINTALTFNTNAATNLAYLNLVPQSIVPGLNTIYEQGVDLFYVDGIGNNIRITQGGGVAGTPGSIANLTPPASASYVSAASTFVFQSNTNIAANLDAASLLMRNISPNSTFALTLQPPTLGANYSITLPPTPGSTSFLQMAPNGVQSASVAVSQGIQDSNIASATLTNRVFAVGTQVPINITSITTTYTVLTSDNLILAGGGAGYTVTLYSAASAPGLTVTIRNTTGQQVVITDGTIRTVLSASGQDAVFISTASGWIRTQFNANNEYVNNSTSISSIAGAGNQFNAMNCVASLTEGVWEITAHASWAGSNIISPRLGIYGADGANTGTQPNNIGNATVIGGFQSSLNGGNLGNLLLVPSASNLSSVGYMTTPNLTITVASGGSVVYSVPGQGAASGTSVSVVAQITAKRVG